MTRRAVTWTEVPQTPAVYAMFGGDHPRTWVAYVGIAGGLQGRLQQHFVRRDSSVVTGSSAVGVNIDLVSQVDWWEHPTFADGDHRHAAEMIAFEVLDPALRSRGNLRRSARELASDPDFRSQMTRLFSGSPTGSFQPPRLSDIAAELRSLEERVQLLEERLGRQCLASSGARHPRRHERGTTYDRNWHVEVPNELLTDYGHSEQRGSEAR